MGRGGGVGFFLLKVPGGGAGVSQERGVEQGGRELVCCELGGGGG